VDSNDKHTMNSSNGKDLRGEEQVEERKKVEKSSAVLSSVGMSANRRGNVGRPDDARTE